MTITTREYIAQTSKRLMTITTREIYIAQVILFTYFYTLDTNHLHLKFIEQTIGIGIIYIKRTSHKHWKTCNKDVRYFVSEIEHIKY